MGGKGARAGRRIRRQLELGVAVTLVSETEMGELLSCGHEGPKGPRRDGIPIGKIIRHCKTCPPFVKP